ncbi:MAG: hypothetical protein K1Y36_00545 [Blastocatellia bacterium]|nr:hypothetical protein [Blastocatellia bacterium]
MHKTLFRLWIIAVLLLTATLFSRNSLHPLTTGQAEMAVGSGTGNSLRQSLTFAERVAAQKALEAVYWRHRIWPRENQTAKPALESVLSQTVLEQKVRDYVQQSQAVEEFRHQPFSGEELQAEINRLVAHTRDTALLRELFAALDNNPFLIAECLARPTLIERFLYSSENKTEILNQVKSKPTEMRLPVFAYVLWQEDSLRKDATCDVWTPTFTHNQNSTPPPCSNHKAVWTGTEMIVWGGTEADEVNTGGRYNPATDSWLALSNIAAPPPRKDHTAIWTGTEMIIWGGFQGGANQTFNSGGRYNPATDTWTATSLVNAPQSRSRHTTVWTGTEMIVWGGLATGLANTGGRYNPQTDSWIPTTLTNAPVARAEHSAIWAGAEMIIWGGWIGGSGRLQDGARYNPGADTWVAISTTNAPANRSLHTAIWTGTQMVVWGGIDPGFAPLGTGAMYNPANNLWTTMTTAGVPLPRSQHQAVWTGTTMIVWGGLGALSSADVLNSGGRFNPVTNSWSPLPISNAPVARTNHAAVWTGSEMIVWGGYAGGPLNSGGRYNPATNSWLPIKTNSAPSARADHCSVWTGTEMVVYGGGYGTGGKYLPATDSWAPISSLSGGGAARAQVVWTGLEMIIVGGYNNYLPGGGARYNPTTDTWIYLPENIGANLQDHTAVWTGSEMIVWGGGYNIGQRYNPGTNSWRQATITGAPQSRKYQTAIWTGSEMIIWGGYTTGGNTPVYFNDGGRYNPVTDTWTPVVPTAETPSPRVFHTVVWTGSRMIVWGGSNSSGILNSGGVWDPTTGLWTATNLTGAPTARTSHTAVWSSQFGMLVWGGGVYPNYVNTGGRYDLATDTWTPISTVGAPTPRYSHTAVWTGSEMIVWGGARTTLPYLFDTGGMYRPCDISTLTLSRFYPLASTPGKALTLSGSGFVSGATEVFFGGTRLIPAAGVNVLSGTTLTAGIPLSGSGNGNLNGFLTVRVNGVDVTTQAFPTNIANPCGGTATFAEFVVAGDVNGDGLIAQANDFALARGFSQFQAVPTARQLLAADVVPLNGNCRGDGVLTTTDITFLRAVSLGQATF